MRDSTIFAKSLEICSPRSLLSLTGFWSAIWQKIENKHTEKSPPKAHEIVSQWTDLEGK